MGQVRKQTIVWRRELIDGDYWTTLGKLKTKKQLRKAIFFLAEIVETLDERLNELKDHVGERQIFK